MNLIQKIARNNGLAARALRGSVWAGTGHIVSQVIRLASNLILTRMLFPEAFGLMSLVTVLMVGVAMLSDVGIGVSISQSRRGDDRNFLDTAWTMQVLRGLLLFVLILLFAWPVSIFYAEPSLTYLLPIASLSVVISGFNPIRLETAGRHLLLGRVTLLDLISQIGGIVATVLFALITPSVWALVIGLVLGAALRLVLANMMIPGEGSHFRIDKSAAKEILQFGKWIIPSTAFGFLLGQGDRLIFGVYLTLEMLGIYNIGQFLAAAPLMLSLAITTRILVPIYREYLEERSPDHARKLRLMRYGLTGATMVMLVVVALVGQPMVTFLYDDRYAQASVIVVMVALCGLPLALGLTYDRGALAAGDSRSFFLVIAFRGTVQTVAFIVGAELGGFFGALLGQCISAIIGHFALIWLARKHGVWDPVHDLVFALSAILLGGLAVYVNWPLLYDFALQNGL